MSAKRAAPLSRAPGLSIARVKSPSLMSWSSAAPAMPTPVERRIDPVFDLRQLQRVEQRQSEMQPCFDPAGDLGRIDADIAGIAQRLGVDHFEHVAQRPGHRQIDGQPFDILPELGQKQRAAGHLQTAQPAPGRREFQPVAVEHRAAR